MQPYSHGVGAGRRESTTVSGCVSTETLNDDLTPEVFHRNIWSTGALPMHLPDLVLLLFSRTKCISKKSINQAEVFLYGCAVLSSHRDARFPKLQQKDLLRKTLQVLALETSSF